MCVNKQFLIESTTGGSAGASPPEVLHGTAQPSMRGLPQSLQMFVELNRLGAMSHPAAGGERQPAPKHSTALREGGSALLPVLSEVQHGNQVCGVTEMVKGSSLKKKIIMYMLSLYSYGWVLSYPIPSYAVCVDLEGWMRLAPSCHALSYPTCMWMDGSGTLLLCSVLFYMWMAGWDWYPAALWLHRSPQARGCTEVWAGAGQGSPKGPHPPVGPYPFILAQWKQPWLCER